MKDVRVKYPVTFTELKAAGQGGTVLSCFLRLHPPAYQSRTGKVCRWERAALPLRNEGLFYLTGHKVAEMQPRCLWSRVNPRKLRAFGTFEQMTKLLDVARRTWNDLPASREIETLFERMFPLKLELEITPLVVKPAKPKRSQAA